MTLSSREKILLGAFTLFIILILGFKFMILPALGSLSTDSQKLLQIQLKIDDANSKATQSKSIDAMVTKALKDAKSASSPLLPSLNKPSLQVYFLNLAKVSGLTVSSINISDPVAASSPADSKPSSSASSNSSTNSTSSSVGSSAEPDYAMKTYAEQYKGISSGSKASAGKSGEAMMSAVDIKMTGNYAAAKSYLNAIRDSKRSIVVSSFKCSSDNNVFTFEITLQCYAAQKLDNSDTIFNWSLPNPSGKNDIM